LARSSVVIAPGDRPGYSIGFIVQPCAHTFA
jgi:hypothetical protein